MYSHSDHLVIHSFPTRRSSDLVSVHPVVCADGLYLECECEATAATGGKEYRVTVEALGEEPRTETRDRKSTRLNSSHTVISYAVFCLKKKNIAIETAILENLHR